jgi:hypothetical protein
LLNTLVQHTLVATPLFNTHTRPIFPRLVLGIVDPPLTLHARTAGTLASALAVDALAAQGGMEILTARHQGLAAGMVVAAGGADAGESVRAIVARL